MPGEVIELGANYVGNFDDLAINISGSFGTNEAESTAANPNAKDTDEWSIGTQIVWAGFTVGGAWRHEENAGGIKNIDRDDVSLGVRYASGPWGVGVQYTFAEKDLVGGGEDEFDGVEVGGSYTLGPGVILSGGIQYLDWDSDTNDPANENEAWIGFIGTHVSF